MSTDLKARTDERQKTDARDSRKFQGLHPEITERVIGVFFEVYNELGGEFLESVYQRGLKIALTQAGFRVAVEVPVPVYFRGEVVGDFRADLIVNHSALLESKAVSSLDSAHDGQILHYLRATTFEVGLLLNFGTKPQFIRFILEEEKKKIHVIPRESVVKALRDF